MSEQAVSDSARSLAHTFIGVSFTLMFIGTSLLTARIWTRLRPVYRVSYDDFFAMIAYVSIYHQRPAFIALTDIFLVLRRYVHYHTTSDGEA